MIYLQAIPAKDAQAGHIKSRLLGTGERAPLVVCLHPPERLIKKYDLNMIFLAGPGTALPASWGRSTWRAILRNLYHKSEDTAGLGILKQFSFPAGSAPLHSRNPARFTREANWAMCCRTPARCVRQSRFNCGSLVGDGESENGSPGDFLALSKFLILFATGGPAILHLNGYRSTTHSAGSHQHEEMKAWWHALGRAFTNVGRPSISRPGFDLSW